ncbi:MAG: pantetheine-phosphate adenylyltransferase [Chloroflexi bacterium]|nr:pantetheine-phosphate adenylyltransferase [Chloroflexota bacterium]
MKDIIALYPGTFDPVHNGHLDIAFRAAKLWSRVIVAVYDTPSKSLMFDTATRVALFTQAVKDWSNIEVRAYRGLTVEFAREVGAQVMVRGLRAISDFEYEYQIALTNKQLAPEIEFCALMTSQAYSFLSSSILKEVALLHGDVNDMCPPHVVDALRAQALSRQVVEATAKRI